MKMLYISDNGYQGKYKDEYLIVYNDECLIVYNEENNEVARYYKKMCVSEVVHEVEIKRYEEIRRESI